MTDRYHYDVPHTTGGATILPIPDGVLTNAAHTGALADEPTDATPTYIEQTEPEPEQTAPDRPRYFYDLEFLEDGHTIGLISIGIVAEDGREYYAVNAEADIAKAKENSWLVANVLPHLPMNNRGCLDRVVEGGRPPAPAELESVDLDRTRADAKPKWKIAEEVREFLTTGLPDDGDTWCELWADYAAYDHVGLAQLWGPMIHLPKGIPMFTHDIQQYASLIGVGHTDLPDNTGGEHHALADARNVRDRWRYLRNTQYSRIILTEDGTDVRT